MIEYQSSDLRKYALLFAKQYSNNADFDSVFNFYYDETNNIKKFYVRENDFNNTFTANFVLGGLVYEGHAPDVQPLIESFNQPESAKEVKFKHIAKGDFLDCIKSKKLSLFLTFLKESNLYVHYSSLNILYWSIVDIVDSAILSSEAAQTLGFEFINRLKNDLYKLSRLEIDSVIKLFYKYEYPNVKKEAVSQFSDDLVSLFDGYIETEEYHFGLETLRQLLKEAKSKGSLPFIMDSDDYILLKNLSHFYLRPISVFKNSQHIFDKEDFIEEILAEYKILDGEEEIKNYLFADSQTSRLIQLSDVFVGLIGKLSNYINSSTREKIDTDLNSLSEIQLQNLEFLSTVIDKSHAKNIGFIHTTDSSEERSKLERLLWQRS